MANRRLPRRKRLMLRYTLLGLGFVLAAVALVLWTRPQSKPYTPGEEVEGITRSLDRAIPPGYRPIVFDEISQQAGIRFVHFSGTRSTQLPEDMGSGAAWGDYDNDGYLDLYVCNIAGPLTMSPSELENSPAGNRLYRNQGDGTFVDVTAAAGVGFTGISMGAAWADYDGDGDLDLTVTNYGSILLYKNDGGIFTEVADSAGLSRFEGFWAGASWADYDLDGDLDLYVCGYVQYRFDPSDRTKSALQYKAEVPFTLNPSSYKAERNLLFQNRGNGTFDEVARAAGVDDPNGRSLSASWADYDEDGWPDIYVANDISDNALFRNLGDGNFSNVAHNAFVADYRGAMGLATGDWENDGDLDIFVTHWIAQENALYSNLKYLLRGLSSHTMSLRFMDVADGVGLGQIALDYIGWGTSFFDFDNDGRQDLLVANGSTFQDKERPDQLIPMKNLLFWNGGEEDGFFEVGAVSGAIFRESRVGRGACFADFDDDGDVDIFVVNQGSAPFLLRNNNSNGNHWIKVRTAGGRRNLNGVGARVEVITGDRRQLQIVGSQSSYLSQNPFELHFGLGRADTVDELIVTFPGGKVSRLQRVAVDQTVRVAEDEK